MLIYIIQMYICMNYQFIFKNIELPKHERSVSIMKELHLKMRKEYGINCNVANTNKGGFTRSTRSTRSKLSTRSTRTTRKR
jgi:hypothetical protein